jgi:hypothetical protein
MPRSTVRRAAPVVSYLCTAATDTGLCNLQFCIPSVDRTGSSGIPSRWAQSSHHESSQANQGEASISLPAARSGLSALSFLLGTMGMHVLYTLESSNYMVDKQSGSCTATTSLNEKAAGLST